MPAAQTALPRARRARRSLTAVLAVLVLPAGAVVALAPTSASAATTVTGIDVASWQHPGGDPIQWNRVRGAGHRFAIIKATEGVTYTNPWFAGDRRGAQQAGLVVGAYHFARPALPLSTADAQARYFAKAIGTQQASRTLPPVLDIESTGGLDERELAQWTKRFLVTLRTATGRMPMIYSYDSFLRTEIDRVDQFAAYPLWLAKYTSVRPTTVPGTWKGWKIWQHTSSGKVPGITGRVDLNHFNGSYSQLLSFASGKVHAGVAQTRVQKHETTRVYGRVDRDFAGQWILRQAKTKNGWQTASKQRVSSTGRFSFPVKLKAHTKQEHRIVLQATTPYARIRSNPVAVRTVKPWIKTTFSDPTVKRRVVTRLRGSVSKFYAGERVYRQKLVGGRWKTMSSMRVSSTGRYDFAMGSTTTGKHSYRVVLRATKPNALATSRTVTLRVR